MQLLGLCEDARFLVSLVNGLAEIGAYHRKGRES
jgi:hypothetical protein